MPNRQLPGPISSFAARRAPESDALSVAELIRVGTLDADLAALVWLTLEARVPLIVAAGPRLVGKSTVLNALLAFLPPTAAVRELAGFDEQFGWLPDALRLGWRRDQAAKGASAPKASSADGGATRPRTDGPADEVALDEPILSPASGFLIAAELSPHLPWYTWGEQARLAIRALTLGYGLGATIHGDSLQDVLDSLRGPDVRLTDDELSHLGVVLVLRALPGGPGGTAIRRIVAAHYVRPMSRDAGGHVQRLAPAVLSTWDAAKDEFEDFSWGVTSELAARVGRSRTDFEQEQRRRRETLEALASSPSRSARDVRRAIDGYRMSGAGHRH